MGTCQRQLMDAIVNDRPMCEAERLALQINELQRQVTEAPKDKTIDPKKSLAYLIHLSSDFTKLIRFIIQQGPLSG